LDLSDTLSRLPHVQIRKILLQLLLLPVPLLEQVIALSMRTAEKILKSRLDEPAQRKLAGEFIDEVGAVQ